MSEERFEEWLYPAVADYQRFVTAILGHEVPEVRRFPLTVQFFPFALPTWQSVGSKELAPDGVNSSAVPSLHDRSERIMGLGQRTVVAGNLIDPGPLRRLSRLKADEEKHGASGAFRLLTVERSIYAQDSIVATQSEFFALGGA